MTTYKNEGVMATSKARAVAPVETPDDIPTHFVKWEDAKKGEDGVYRVAGETRLTAEQFYHEWAEGPSIRGIKRSGNLDALTFEFAEAFRDKSESQEIMLLEHEKESWRASYEKEWKVAAGLREEIERLNTRLNRQIDLHSDSLDKLTELRAKLAEVREARQGWIRQWNEANTKRAAAEVEAAALRERERWIPVEERLPEPHEEVLIWFRNREGDENQTDSWLEKNGKWAMGSASGYNVTHWKALSAAPERP